MRPVLTKGEHGRWEDYEITGEKITYKGVIWPIYCFWLFSHCRSVLSFTNNAHIPFRPIHDFRTPFNWQKPTLTKAVSILSAPFSQKWTLFYHLTLRGRNFTLALGTVLKLMLNKSVLIALSAGITNSVWPTRHFVTLLSERVTVVDSAVLNIWRLPHSLVMNV